MNAAVAEKTKTISMIHGLWSLVAEAPRWQFRGSRLLTGPFPGPREFSASCASVSENYLCSCQHPLLTDDADATVHDISLLELGSVFYPERN
jgi:hypothetical protein